LEDNMQDSHFPRARPPLSPMQLWEHVKDTPQFDPENEFLRSIIYVENRPGGHGSYRRQIEAVFRRLKEGEGKQTVNPESEIVDESSVNRHVEDLVEIFTKENTGPLAEIVGFDSVDIFSDPITRSPIRKLLRDGLRHGWFLDTNKIRTWIQKINRIFDKSTIRLPQLQLLVFHSHTESQDLHRLVVKKGFRPAGKLLSGSGDMLDQEYKKRYSQRTLSSLQSCLDRSVPVLGMCYGYQQLEYQEHGILPIHHSVPNRANHELLPQVDHVARVNPGQRRMVYGCRKIEAIGGIDHPVMFGVNSLQGLEAHSMGYELGHPDCKIPIQTILATSRRHFISDKESGLDQDSTIIEVVAPRPNAIGVQLHPELTPEFLIALLELSNFSGLLQSQGYDLEMLREELRLHPKDSMSAGERLGFNFLSRVLVPDWLEYLVDRSIITRNESKELLELLFAEIDY
jgi:hypothetical protein